MKYLLNIARAFDIIIIFVLYFSYFLTLNIDFLIFFIGLFLNHKLNDFLKHSVFLQIFGRKDIPLLGKGIRPQGAKHCCSFKPCNPIYPKSYGMPSGHSQGAGFFSMLVILFLLENRNKNNSFITIFGCFISIITMLFIMYSRVLIKCHTIQQTIIGSLIGILFAFLLFKYKSTIKKKLKKYKNSDLYVILISSIILILYFINKF
jgi:membrane-associated phospholipid phosphatase